MNYLKSITLMLMIMLIISTFSFAQEMSGMKKDSMKTGMMKENMKKEQVHEHILVLVQGHVQDKVRNT